MSGQNSNLNKIDSSIRNDGQKYYYENDSDNVEYEDIDTCKIKF